MEGGEHGKSQPPSSKDNTDMEGRKNHMKDQKKKITRKKKRFKRKKFDKEKTCDEFMALCPTVDIKIDSPQAVKVRMALSFIYFP